MSTLCFVGYAIPTQTIGVSCSTLLFCLAFGLAVVVWLLGYVCLAVWRLAFRGRIEDKLFLLRYVKDSFRRKSPLSLTAVDYAKAFDSVDRAEVVEAIGSSIKSTSK